MKTQTKNNNQRKRQLTLVALLATLVIVTGSIFAFFSDVVTHDNTITAGTLDLIKGKTEITQNGLPDSDNTIDNFNPGDVVTFSVDVENEGSKSAWLRGNMKMSGGAVTTIADPNDTTTFADTFAVFEGTVTQADAETKAGGTDDLTTTAAWTFKPGDTEATFEDPNATIINGKTGLPDTETETNGVASKTLTYTVYFKKSALNKWQAKDLLVEFKAEGIQYRNNSGKDWSDLVQSPFGK